MDNSRYQSFIERHRLPASYLDQAFTHYNGVIEGVLKVSSHGNPVTLGINGCQGSGKTTLAAFIQSALETEHGLRVVSVSLDDFYLSKHQRLQLSQEISPLLQTRGVPGTHDIQLAIDTLQALKGGKTDSSIFIPRFDKSTDDIFPKKKWNRIDEPVDVIILEGWCLGVRSQTDEELETPINSLEQEHDADCIWRNYVNTQLQRYYPELFGLIDIWVMLRAPSFQSVYRWRLEQEEKLAKKLQTQLKRNSRKEGGTKRPSGLMDSEQILQFVQYFQRLTEVMLSDMPNWVDHLYQLDEQRRVIDEKHRNRKENA